MIISSAIYRVDKKRDKLERKVLDSQERAFWDVHRPVVRLILIKIINTRRYIFKYTQHVSIVTVINFVDYLYNQLHLVTQTQILVLPLDNKLIIWLCLQ